jgi:serine/threonine protein kinase
MGALFKAKVGQTLDERFVLLEEIGRGGMSIVFKASDLRDGVQVAVKVPLPQYSSGVGSWSMFEREAEIGRKLDHPGIVRFVELPPRRTRNYVVTEYLAAPSLATRVGRGLRLPESEALRIMSAVSDAIDYLHARGFVHYDLKPGNVIVMDDGSIRVIDLGMAHEALKTRFTFAVPSPPFATSEYVAPEQISRKRGQRSADIYALGAMLYQMLTGRAPFEGDDPFVVASARQIGDPPAPRSLCPEVSPQAEEVVLRALRRDPAERYPTAGAMKADLDDIARVSVSGLAGRLVKVTPARKRLRLMRFVAVTSVAPVVLLAAMFRILWWVLDHGH